MDLTFENLHKDIQRLIDEEICDYVLLDKSELKKLMLEHHYDDIAAEMVYQDNGREDKREMAIVFMAKFIETRDEDWIHEAREYIEVLIDDTIDSIYEDIKEERKIEVGYE